LPDPYPFKKGFILAYIFIALHIFLDLITSYGTQILFPLTNTRYALTSVFILDPIYTFVMVYLMYRTFKTPNIRKTLAIVGVVWIFLYPAVNLGIRYTLQYYIEGKLRTEGMEFTRIDVSTDILTPIFWKVIVDDGTAYHIGGVSLLRPTAPISFTSFQKADQKLFQTLGKSASLFNTYQWFFDFPIVRTEISKDGKETRVMLEDLRFASTVSFIQNLRTSQNLPFSLIAVLNEKKQLIRYYYNGTGQAKMIELLE
jgi:inner membrane protein